MEKKKHKILKRILSVICAMLVIATALISPISAIVDSSQGTGTNYDLTARSTYPMTVGLAFDTGEQNVVFATDIGGFGQEFNTTLNGTDSFYWTSEASTADELDGALTYQFEEVREQDKQYYNWIGDIGPSYGYGLASYRPIKISAQSGTDLVQGQDCSSIVYRMRDVVINSSLIRKGNYFANIHPEDDGLEIFDPATGTIIHGYENGNYYSPNAEDYRYLVPHIALPAISTTSGYVGTYNVVATITDEWGQEWDFNYSYDIDTRGATSAEFIPFLPMSIFDSYGKSFGEQAYNIGMSNTVVLNDYYGYLDIDYYEYKNVIPDFNLIVDLYAEVGGEQSLVNRDYLPMGEYVGLTFDEWVSSVDGQNGYTVTGGAGGITMTYTDTENDFTYSGTITDSSGTQVYGATIISMSDEYTATLQREEVVTEDALAGTWVLNTSLTSLSSSFSFQSLNGTFNSIGRYSSSNIVSKEIVNFVISGTDASYGDYGLIIYGGTNYPANFYYSSSNDIQGRDGSGFGIGTIAPDSPLGNELRTFTITSKLGKVTNGDVLLTWLQANATKQSTASVASVSEDTTSTSTDNTATVATIDSSINPSIAEWVKVEGTEYGRSAMVTLPLWDTSNLVIGGPDYNLYSTPTIQKFIDGAKGTLIPVLETDYTSWMGTAVGGFLSMELMPNFSIGGILAILIGFSIVMLFLKFFAGG